MIYTLQIKILFIDPLFYVTMETVMEKKLTIDHFYKKLGGEL